MASEKDLLKVNQMVCIDDETLEIKASKSAWWKKRKNLWDANKDRLWIETKTGTREWLRDIERDLEKEMAR